MSQPREARDRRGAKRRRIWQLWLWLLGPPLLIAVAVAVVLASTGPLRDDAAAPLLNVPQDVGIDQRLGEKVPLDLSLRNERGEAVRIKELLNDKPIILVLVYFRCPMLCSMTMDGLVRSLKNLPLDAGKDFTVWTVSFDPREGPELAAAAKRTALARYGRAGAEEDWHFLTGDESSVRQLAGAVGFRYRYVAEQDQYAHAAGLIVLTPDGTVARYLYGVQFPAGQLRLALTEASRGRVGSLTEQLLLLCYNYDPATGRYGLATVRLLRLAAATTVLGLVGGIGWMLYREKRSQGTGVRRQESGDRSQETGDT
jgi:protein SCO1/2